MVCLGCQALSGERLCSQCAGRLRLATDRVLPGGLRLIAAFEHIDPARTLIHHLKYRGVTWYAGLVAEVLVNHMPRLPVVPVPRALSRRLKYGVDPSRVIARALADRLKVPVIDALAAPIHMPRRAGKDHSRTVRPFRLRTTLRSEVILVDDVVTTGATVIAAVEAFGPNTARTVAAANVVPGVSNVTAEVTSPQPGVDRVWQRF